MVADADTNATTANPVTPGNTAVSDSKRIYWLDGVRLLAAFMILGIHWLRACSSAKAVGMNAKVSLIRGYQGQTIGLGMLPHVLITGTHAGLAGWLTNAVGLFGGFGWEAVSALVLISGFSLTLSLQKRKLSRAAWIVWLQKRAERILVPFYLVALPFIATYLPLLAYTSHHHGGLSAAVHAKLSGLFNTPLLGILLSHTLLFDPFAPFWGAQFFAPAWWFVPAILVAYVLYPIWRTLMFADDILGLVLAAMVTIGAYVLADNHLLLNEDWSFIALQECFNFALGIFVARRWIKHGRRRIEAFVVGPAPFIVGLVAFIGGSILNWSPTTRPVASMLYGPGLVLTLVGCAKALEFWKPMRVAIDTLDSYDLYLVHQPFAFPVAVLCVKLFHGFAVSVGFGVFMAVVGMCSIALGKIQIPVYAFVRSRTTRTPASI